ncbi:MAG: sugar nucleotidyltransferase [Gemmatimonadota bacterium]|nr:sugar nucleotidyltransferase [Gemmatimonadota bacterium]MDE3216370.1 sugar nucleotidyltransferase [Gemmatimonadota bacterium]
MTHRWAQVTKAVVLARGLGTRMRREDPGAALDEAQRAAASAGVKAMIPIGRPFLDYALSALADAGCTDACLVIGPEHGEIRDYYTGRGRPRRVRVAFAEQALPRGTADALLSAEAFAAGDRVLMVNSDNYYPPAALAALRAVPGAGLLGFERDALVRESNVEPERVLKYALLSVRADGTLERIVEKPDEATARALGADALVSMNAWVFTPAIFEACRRVAPSARGELELQDAVRIAIDDMGERFTVVRVAAGVLDLSSRSDIEAVRRRLAGVEADP